jgi:hypothetical protein
MTNEEDKFSTIAVCAILEAEKVKCSLLQFKEGLKTIIAEFETRLQCVNEELGEK